MNSSQTTSFLISARLVWLSILSLSYLLLTSCQPSHQLSDPVQASNTTETAAIQPEPFTQNFIRIKSTIKAPIAHLPWQLPRPSNQYGMGVMLKNGYILTSANMIIHASYIEISDSDELIKEPAKVIAIDHDSNLALLSSQLGEHSELKSQGIDFSAPITKDETAEIWQVESRGESISTSATFQKALMISTRGDVGSTLGYQLKASLQRASNSFCLPVTKDDKLLGIMVSYRADEQICNSVSLESIKRFVDTFEQQGNYGLPLLGFNFQNSLNPTYRKWLKLPESEQGIIVTTVKPNSPMAESGIEKYDVITHISGYDLDSKGYFDHPNYSKIYWTALIEQAYPKSDTLSVKGYRKGEPFAIDIPLHTKLKNKQQVVRNFFNQDPLYLIHGGFIFQELSLPYLRNIYGGQWSRSIPHNYFEIINQELETPANGTADASQKPQRIVILSRTIPTPITQGYEGIAGSIVSHINGQPITSIQDIKAHLGTTPRLSPLGIHTIKLDREHQINEIIIDHQGALKVNQNLEQRGLPLMNF